MPDDAPAAVGRQARALRLLTCLQSGPGFSAKELARQLKVSRRTIFRDLNLIRAAGIQIHFDEQHDSYRLSHPRGALVAPRFEEQCLAQLVLATQLSPLHHFTDISLSLRDSVAKLLSLHPYAVSSSITRLYNSCLLRKPAEEFPPHTQQVVIALLEAIRYRKKIRLSLASANGEAAIRTKVAPYRLLVDVDEWRLVGRSTFHRRTRVFELRRIRQVEVTDEPFSIPRGFRLREP